MPDEADEPRERLAARAADELARFAQLVDGEADAVAGLIEQGVTRAAAEVPDADAARWLEAARVWIVRAALSEGRRLNAGVASEVDAPRSTGRGVGVESAFAASSPLQRCVTVLHWFEHLDASGIAAVVGSTAEGITAYLDTVRERLGIGTDATSEQQLRRLLRTLYEDADPDLPEVADIARRALALPSAQELTARRWEDEQAARQARAEFEAAERAAADADAVARSEAADRQAAEVEDRRAAAEALTRKAEDRRQAALAAAAEAEQRADVASTASAEATQRAAETLAAAEAALAQAEADADARRAAAETERQAAEAAADEAQQRATEAQQRSAAAEQRTAELDHQLAELDTRRATLEQAVADAETLTREAEHRRQAALAAAAEAEQRADAANTASAEATQRAAETLAAAEAALAQAEADADADARRAAAETERQAAEAAAGEAQQRAAEAQQRSAAAEQRTAELEQRHADLDHELTELEARREALEQAAADAEQRHADAVRAIAEAETYAAGIEQHADTATQLARERTANAEAVLAQAEAEAAEERDALETLRARAAEEHEAADAARRVAEMAAAQAVRRRDEAERRRAEAEAAAAVAVAAAGQAAAQAARAAAEAKTQEAAADREICERIKAEQAAAEAEQRRQQSEAAAITAETALSATVSTVERTERTLLELTSAADRQRRAAATHRQSAAAAIRERDEALAAIAEASRARDDAERATAEAVRGRVEAEQAEAAAVMRRAEAERAEDEDEGPDDGPDNPDGGPDDGPDGGPDDSPDDSPDADPGTPTSDGRVTTSTLADGASRRTGDAASKDDRRRAPGRHRRLLVPRWAFTVLAVVLSADYLVLQWTAHTPWSTWWIAVPATILETCGAAVVTLLAVSRARGPHPPAPGFSAELALSTATDLLHAAGRDLVRTEFRPALDAALEAVADARRELTAAHASGPVLRRLRRRLARLSRAMLRVAAPTPAEIAALGRPSGFLDLDPSDEQATSVRLDALARRARSPLAAVECVRDLLAVVAPPDPPDGPPVRSRPGLVVALAQGLAALATLVYAAVPAAFLLVGRLPWPVAAPSLADATRAAPLLVVDAAFVVILAGNRMDMRLLPLRAARGPAVVVLAASLVAGIVRAVSGSDGTTPVVAIIGVAALLALITVRPRTSSASLVAGRVPAPALFPSDPAGPRPGQRLTSA